MPQRNRDYDPQRIRYARHRADEPGPASERYDFGDEDRGEPYYREGGRFGEPRGRRYAEEIERAGEPWYPQGRRPLEEGDWGEPEYGSYGHYGEYRGGGRWTATPDVPRHLGPAEPMTRWDAHERGAYYYGPRGDEDRRYDPDGRDFGANWTRPQSHPGYPEAQGYSARGTESYRGVGPKGYTRSDERIKEDVCERLRDDDRVDASDVTVTASGGVVTLEGTVPHRWMKHGAENVACRCGGVKDVQNHLAIRREEAGDPSHGGFGEAGNGRSRH